MNQSTMNQLTMNQSTGIHCKIICDGQMRRFQFSGNEFPSLQKQVKQLLGLNREFLLKYKDNEGDMITLSSTEELSCAMEISQNQNGGLLRLAVFNTEPSTDSKNETRQPFNVHSVHMNMGNHHQHEPRNHHHGNGYGGKWGHHGRGGGLYHHELRNSFKNFDQKPGCQFGSYPENQNTWEGQKQCHGSEQLPCKNRFEKRKDKLTFKRDMFSAYLSSLEQIKELSPEEERRKQMYLTKVQKIDSVLDQFYSTKKMDQQPQFEKMNTSNQMDVIEPKKVDLPQLEKMDSWNQKDEYQFPKKMDQQPQFEKKNWKQRDTEYQYPKKQKYNNKNFEKKEKKFEKKFDKKKEYKEIKKEKRDFKYSEISEESKNEIISLKNQIKELKPLVWDIDEKLKCKKAEARKSFENGQPSGASVKNDIIKLKQEKRDIKDKISPLHQRIYQLKTGGKSNQ